MDSAHNAMPAENQVQLHKFIDFINFSQKADGVDDFAEQGLSDLSEILQAPGSFLFLRETTLFPRRFFHQQLITDTATWLAGQADRLLDQFVPAGAGQPILFALPQDAGPEVDFHLYILRRDRDPLGMLGFVFHRENPSLSPQTRELLVESAMKTILKLLEKEDNTQKRAHLCAYQTVVSMLKQTMDLNELLEMGLYAIMDVLSAEAASVLLLTDDKKHFTFFAVEGDAKPVISDKHFPADTGIAGSVLRSRQPEIINDVQHDPRFYRNIDSETGFRTNNMIVLPLVAGEEPVGVLEVINKEGGRTFTEREQQLLCSIADEIAFAIRNAKIFDYIVGTYCKQRQGQMSCKGCKRPLGSWTPCVKYQESEFKKAAVVEETIYHDWKARGTEDQGAQNRRRLDRQAMKLPAVVHGIPQQGGEFETGTVLEISLEGIRFSIPKRDGLDNLPLDKLPEFSIIFILTAEQRPIKATCAAKWVSASGESLQIGAAFVDPEASISQALQQHLT